MRKEGNGQLTNNKMLPIKLSIRNIIASNEPKWKIPFEIYLLHKNIMEKKRFVDEKIIIFLWMSKYIYI